MQKEQNEETIICPLCGENKTTIVHDDLLEIKEEIKCLGNYFQRSNFGKKLFDIDRSSHEEIENTIKDVMVELKNTLMKFLSNWDENNNK